MTETQIALAAKRANLGAGGCGVSNQTVPLQLSNVKCSDETLPDGYRVCQECKHARPLVLFAEGQGRSALICQGCFDSSKPERLRRLRLERRAHQGMKAFPIEVRRRAQQIWARARLNAWRKGILFDISQQWIAVRILVGRCEVTSIRFDLDAPRSTLRGQFGPSLDRRDPCEGYTTENCQVVVWIYNNAKSDGSHEDVMRLACALVEMGRHVAARAASEAGKMEQAA